MFIVEATSEKIYLGVHFLKRGEVVILPTDTLYGLCTDAINYKAVEKVYQLKNRNPQKPLIVLISQLNWLKKFFFINQLPEKVKKLFLFEEPISILLPVKGFEWISRGSGKIAFRLVKGGFIKNFLDWYGRPIVAPSANWEGFPPARDAFQAFLYFGNFVKVYYNTGPLKGQPSTLVEPFEERIKILREGDKRTVQKILQLVG